MTEYEAFIRDAAQRRGIDPDIAVRVANSEGSVTEPARRGTFDTGSSWWGFQLHYGGAGYEHLGTVAGMGNGFTALTGWQPGDPAAWRDAARYALNRAKASGWGAWYGAAHVGISQWQGIDRNHPWDAASETWDYETGGQPMPTIPFNPDAPVAPQPDAWSCAIRSAQWLLRAVGRNPGDNWIVSHLVDEGIVTREHGLMDASGQQLADWINREYGNEMGFTAQASSVTFDDVAAGAGTNPTLIGGRKWNHWSGVRALRSDGALRLANPADGWQGVGQMMTRQQFDNLGPFTAIWIDRTGAVAEPPPAPPVDTRLERMLALLRQAIAIADEPAPAA